MPNKNSPEVKALLAKLQARQNELEAAHRELAQWFSDNLRRILEEEEETAETPERVN